MSSRQRRIAAAVAAIAVLSSLVVGCESLPQAEANGASETTASVGEKVTLSYRIAGGGGCTNYDDVPTAPWIVTPADGASVTDGVFVATKPGTYSVTVPLPPDNETEAAPAIIRVTEQSGSSGAGSGDTALSEDAGDASGAETGSDKLWMVGNDNGVTNGGAPATVTLASDVHIDEIWTYHYNDAAGAPAGTITMTAADGTVIGAFPATLVSGVYWVAKVDRDVAAGTYVITDSDPATWSTNEGTKGQGHTWATGTVK